MIKSEQGSFAMEAAFVVLAVTCIGLAFYVALYGASINIVQNIVNTFLP
jgi:hypothetical protein